MKYRIAMWAGAGFLVAGYWALYACRNHANYALCQTRDHDSRAVDLPPYALLGLTVETLRQRLKSGVA